MAMMLMLVCVLLNVPVVMGTHIIIRKCKYVDKLQLSVDCSKKGLNYVPDYLHDNIESLNLRRNFITVLNNDSFQQYGMLKKLLLGGNKIYEIATDTFWNQTYLEVLDLSNNNLTNITEVLLPALLEQVVSLEQLDIRNNMKERLQQEFVYPDESLALLTNLSKLYMDLTTHPYFGGGFWKLTKLMVLAFDVCHLENMKNSTFINFTNNLKELHLMKCHFVQNVECGFLMPFKNLKVLNLADSYIHLSRALLLLYPLANSTMDVINFQHVSYELYDTDSRPYTLVVTSDMMKYLQTICVKTLNLAANGIVDFQKHSLMTYNHPECLVNLILSANRFTFHHGRKAQETFLLVVRMINLELFDFSYNPIRFTNETYLNIPNGALTYDPQSTGCTSELHGRPGNFTIPLPPKLKTLRLSHYVRQSCGDSVIVNMSASLKFLDMSYYQFQRFPNIYIIGENNLETLNMSGIDSSLYLAKRDIPLFQNVRNARFQNAELGKSAKNSGHLLKLLPSVAVLDISHNSIWTLPADLFSSNIRLEIINLSHNMLHEVPSAVMTIKSLRTLNLAFNNLVTIGKDVTKWLDTISSKRNISVYLEGNVFSCSCENKEFLRWLQSTKVHFDKHGNYSCRLANGAVVWTSDANFHELFSDCNAETWMKIGLSLLITIVVLIIIVATIFNFRWRIAYFIYRKCRVVIESELNLKYTYDAYISYADDSEDWVKNFLVKKAEKIWGLQLCIDDRDIPGGRELIDGIAESIQNSRHVIFVLTPDLLHRELTAFEIQRAKYENVHNHVQITVLNLGVDIDDVPREFSSVWHDVHLIEWNDIPTFSDVSWGKLKVKLMLSR